MPAKNVSDVLTDAARVVDVWTANPTFSMGTVTLESFKAIMAALQAADNAVESKRTELTGFMNVRDSKADELNDLVSRARSGVRAAFGPDSTEYEQVGGTRRSERKSPIRKNNGEVVKTP